MFKQKMPTSLVEIEGDKQKITTKTVEGVGISRGVDNNDADEMSSSLDDEQFSADGSFCRDDQLF